MKAAQPILHPTPGEDGKIPKEAGSCVKQMGTGQNYTETAHLQVLHLPIMVMFVKCTMKCCINSHVPPRRRILMTDFSSGSNSSFPGKYLHINFG